MRFTGKINAARAIKKLGRMRALMDADNESAVRDYGRAAVKLAYNFTPPCNGRRGNTVAGAVRKLRQRIAQDLATNAEPLETEWRRPRGSKGAQPVQVVRIPRGAKIGPFLAVTKKHRSALKRSGVELPYTADAGAHMRANRTQYPLKRGRNAVKLSWRGRRVGTSGASVKREIRRRQLQAGKMLAGWNAFADIVGAKKPAAAGQHAGRGFARRDRRRHAVRITGGNSTQYGRGDLNSIVAKNDAKIKEAVRRMARSRLKQTRRRLK